MITACTITALLYGEGDLARTIEFGFNLGWDADNTAATAGTIIGVIKGRAWMEAQGWEIGTEYHNYSRDDMPMDETINGYADRIVAVASRVIEENGGRVIEKDGAKTFEIKLQTPAVVEPLVDTAAKTKAYHDAARKRVEAEIYSDSLEVRRQAVLDAFILGFGHDLMRGHPAQMNTARVEFQKWMVTNRDMGARLLFNEIMFRLSSNIGVVVTNKK